MIPTVKIELTEPMQMHNKLRSLGIAIIILYIFIFPIMSPTQQLVNTSTSRNYTLPHSAAISNAIYISNLARTYNIDQYGLLKIEDIYVFENNGSASIGYLDLCLTNTEAEHLIFYSANNEQLGSIAIQLLPEKINDFTTLEIILNEPLYPLDSIKITVHQVFRDLLNYTRGTSDETNGFFGITTQCLPVSPYPIQSAIYYINTPADSTLIKSNGTNIDANPISPNNPYSNLNPYTNFSIDITYQNTKIAFLRVLNLQRTIRINPVGYVQVVETHLLKNYAGDTATFYLRIPAKAESLKVSDDLGIILGVTEASSVNKDRTKNVTFNLQTNRAGLAYLNQIYYEIEYFLPIDDFYTKSITDQNVILDIFTTKAPFIIDQQSIEIEVIGAYKITSKSVGLGDQFKTEEGLGFQVLNTYICENQIEEVGITFRSNPIQIFQRALLFMLFFAAIFTLYIFYRTAQRAKAPKEVAQDVAIPIRELREFIRLYEEKNALLLDIEKADEDLNKRKIQKKAHSRTVKTYTDKIKEIDGELQPFKSILLESDPKVQNLIQQLDYLEAEKISVKDSTILLEDRYRRGKLPSKAAFDRLNTDLQKRIVTIQQKIDKNINELRAFLI